MVAIARRDAPDRALEGIFRAGSSLEAGGVVVAPPHPLYGGSMDSPVVNELAWAAAQNGLASLRFNWRGVGASAGEASGEAGDADADYASALDHLEETVTGPLVACGYSFGAAAAVRAAAGRARVDRLVLVAPPPALIDPAAIAASGRRTLVLVGQADRLAPPAALSQALADAGEIRLEVIPRADHFFAAGLADLARLSAAWLAA
jgi:alpha/beta superfamily hydrolase